MSDIRMVDVMRNADVLVRKSLGVKENEQVLIITDTEYDFIVPNAIAAAVRCLGAEPTIAIMPKRQESGATRIVEQAIAAADVVVSNTTRSVVHAAALRMALHEKKSVRLASTVGTTVASFISDGASADPDEMHQITLKAAEAIRKGQKSGKKLRFTSELGTDLTGSIEGMPVRVAGGFALNPGDLCMVPDGEVWLAPTEGTAEGTVVFDKIMTYLGTLSEPVKCEVRKGRVVSIEGGRDAERLKELIEGVENADNIAEMALGTNPKANYIGEILNDKHVLGCVHVALGDNRIYGGNTACAYHIDGVVSKATVEIDDQVIFRNGEFVL